MIWFLSHGLMNTLQDNINPIDLTLRPNSSPNVLIRHHLPAQEGLCQCLALLQAKPNDCSKRPARLSIQLPQLPVQTLPDFCLRAKL